MVAPYDAVASRQLGLLTHRQLTELQWTQRQIDWAVATGALFRLRRGVYRTSGAPVTQVQTWLAAQLAAGDGVVLANLTAVAAWGFRGYPPPDRIHLLAKGASRTRLEGVTGHRTTELPVGHVTAQGPLRLTTPARTLVDTCGQVGHSTLKAAARCDPSPDHDAGGVRGLPRLGAAIRAAQAEAGGGARRLPRPPSRSGRERR